MSVVEDRCEFLGIVYCELCRVDTIPSETTGRCFFCDSQLVETLRSRVVAFPLDHVRCQCGHGVGAHDDVDGYCAGCPCALFTPAEVKK